MKKFKNLRNLFLMVFALMVLMVLASACKTQDDPPLPPPPPPTYYTIQMKYTRPAGSIKSPDQLFKHVGVCIIGNCNWGPCDFTFGFYERTDDYHFLWSEPEVMPDNELLGLYAMYGIDDARWDGVHNDTGVVGDIFTIKVKETGFEKELTNIVPDSKSPYRGPNSRMVLWRLNKNGTISDN